MECVYSVEEEHINSNNEHYYTTTYKSSNKRYCLFNYRQFKDLVREDKDFLRNMRITGYLLVKYTNNGYSILRRCRV